MDNSELLVAWSIRLAVMLFFVVLVVQMQGHSGQRIGIGLRILWTASFLLCVLHVVAAFHFVHHWSHSAAYSATANETREKLGFAYGAGIYFNYLLLVVWALDVYWIWRSPEKVSMPTRWLVFAARCYLLFIVFNGVVVFKSGWLRLLGSIATVVLFGIAMRHREKLFGLIAK